MDSLKNASLQQPCLGGTRRQEQSQKANNLSPLLGNWKKRKHNKNFSGKQVVYFKTNHKHRYGLPISLRQATEFPSMT